MRARDDLLAGAALAAEQHGRERRRGLLEPREALLHRGRARRRAGPRRSGPRGAGASGGSAAAWLADRERLVDREEDLVAIEGLEQEVRRARLHRLDRERHRAVRGDQDDRHVGRALLHLAEAAPCRPCRACARRRSRRRSGATRARRSPPRRGDLVRVVTGLLEQRREHHARRRDRRRRPGLATSLCSPCAARCSRRTVRGASAEQGIRGGLARILGSRPRDPCPPRRS